MRFQHSQTQNIGCYKANEAANSRGATPDISRNASSYQELKKNNNKKEKNNNKKIIRSLQNTTKKTRRKLKEEEDLNDKLTNKLQKCRAQRLSKNKSEKKEVSPHKGGVALYTS